MEREDNSFDAVLFLAPTSARRIFGRGGDSAFNFADIARRFFPAVRSLRMPVATDYLLHNASIPATWHARWLAAASFLRGSTCDYARSDAGGHALKFRRDICNLVLSLSLSLTLDTSHRIAEYRACLPTFPRKYRRCVYALVKEQCNFSAANSCKSTRIVRDCTGLSVVSRDRNARR